MDRSLRIRMLLEAGDKVTRPLRDITQGSSKAAAALKATRDRLKEIERAQTDIAGFRALKTGLRQSEQAMHSAQVRATELGRAIAEADRPTRAMTRDFKAARNEAERLTREYQQNSTRLGEVRDRLRSAGVETRQLARHERELREAAARTNREISEQGRRMTTLVDRTRRLNAARASFDRINSRAAGLAAGGASAIGTGVALAAPVIGSVKAAQDYQSAMTDIAQKANLSRRDAEAMGRGLLVAARAANQMPADLQQGVDTLSGFGLDPRQAVAMMQPIGRAATAYKAEIADLSAAAFAANDNLKVPVAQTARVIDIMAQAGKSGAFEIKDMAGAFPALTAGYQALGQSGTAAVADLAAALQIARKGAGDSATAANNVANVIQKIASPQTIKAFAKFGIDLPNALKKAYSEGKTPLEAIAELTEKATKGDLGKIGFLFEDAQAQNGLRPLIQNMKEYRAIRAEAAGANGTTDRDFAERMRDSAEQTRQLKVNAQALGITLGSTLLPAVNATLTRVTAFTAGVTAWARENPGFAKGLAITAAVAAGLFIVLGGAALAIAGVLAPFAALNAVAAALGIGLLPVIGVALGVVAAIALLAAGAYLIYRNWGAISGWLAAQWAEIKAAFSGGIAGIAALLVNFSPLGLLYRNFAALMTWLGIAMPARLTDAGRNLILGLVNGITSKLALVKDTVIGAAKSVATWFKNALGIRSPSRLFMGFGGYLTQGLAIGIQRGAGAPVAQLRTMVDTMRGAAAERLAVPPIVASRLATAAAVAITASSPSMAASSLPAGAAPVGSAAAPMSVTIQIVQQPGQSAQDLARLVADEIDRRQRQQEARGRSTFRDRQDYGSLD